MFGRACWKWFGAQAQRASVFVALCSIAFLGCGVDPSGSGARTGQCGMKPRAGSPSWGRYAFRVTDSIRLDDEVRRRSFEDQVEHDAGPRRALDGSTFLVTESDHVTDVQPDAVSPVKVAADDLGIGRDRACGLEDLELNPVGKGHAERASLAGRVGELEANLPGRPQAVLERTVDRVGADHPVPRVT